MSKISSITRYTAGAALLASAIGLGFFGLATAVRDGGFNSAYAAERGHDEDHSSNDHSSEERGKEYGSRQQRDVVMDSAYQEECGACHVAYPPQLLPSESWKAIMSGLNDHFGDNAELPAELAVRIAAFLDGNASDRGDRMKYTRLMRDTNGTVPVRITKLPYFKEEHDEIPRRMVEDNPQVESFSRCDACHKDAAKGRFDEENAAIPGFGNWNS